MTPGSNKLDWIEIKIRIMFKMIKFKNYRMN